MRRVHNVSRAYNKLLNKLSDEQDMELTERILESFKQKRELQQVEELTNGRESRQEVNEILWLLNKSTEQSAVPNKNNKD